MQGSISIFNQIIVRGDDKGSFMKHRIEKDNYCLIIPSQAIEGATIWIF